jgi:hypothetical protein
MLFTEATKCTIATRKSKYQLKVPNHHGKSSLLLAALENMTLLASLSSEYTSAAAANKAEQSHHLSLNCLRVHWKNLLMS